MRARVLAFPVKGRSWCFFRAADALPSASAAAPHSLSDLWRRLSSGGGTSQDRAELAAEYVADKMQRSWVGLENAPPGSIKNRIHSFGLKLLSRVRPTEVFLRSLTKEVTGLEITYPAGLNPRFVRRRLRLVALSGLATHKKYLYGSVSLIPATGIFMVLPFPNVAFFWLLFRSYSHWRALQGSERLLLLASDESTASTPESEIKDSNVAVSNSSSVNPQRNASVLKPSEDLEALLSGKNLVEGLDCETISTICKEYDLDKREVLKYRDLQ